MTALGGGTDPRVDAYIRRARPFARPILEHLRRLVHANCPDANETLTWGFPHFGYRGQLCSMVAFDDHVAFGFHRAQALRDVLPPGAGTAEKDPEGVPEAVGQFGRITRVRDLPPGPVLGRIIRRAAELNAAGVRLPSRTESHPRAIEIPAYFARALRENREALRHFDALTPAQQFEYVEWVTGAKVPATRERRLAQTIEWLAEGKTRHWRRHRS